MGSADVHAAAPSVYRCQSTGGGTQEFFKSDLPLVTIYSVEQVQVRIHNGQEPSYKSPHQSSLKHFLGNACYTRHGYLEAKDCIVQYRLMGRAPMDQVTILELGWDTPKVAEGDAGWPASARWA